MTSYYPDVDSSAQSAAQIIKTKYRNCKVCTFIFLNKNKGYYYGDFCEFKDNKIGDIFQKEMVSNFNSRVIALVHNNYVAGDYYTKIDKEIIKELAEIKTIYLVNDKTALTYQYYPLLQKEIITL